MKIRQAIINSFTLAIANLFSILLGYIAYHFFSNYDQVTIQAPTAFLFSATIFILWSIFARNNRFAGLMPGNFITYILIFILAFAWIPAVFYPLHYFTQHYVSSFNNIAWVWAFQVPVNSITLTVTYFILKKFCSQGKRF